MSSMNRVTILGHLGADPELRHTAGGQPVASLRIATNEAWTDKNGEKQEKTEWHRVSVFGKSAENCGAYLTKGRQVLVEGRLQTREYTDKEGVKRWATDIVANQVLFLGGGERGQNGSSSFEATGTNAPRRFPAPPSDPDGAFGFEERDEEEAAPAATPGRPLRVTPYGGSANASDIPF